MSTVLSSKSFQCLTVLSDNSGVSQTIFIDFSKASDTINHGILIEKLQFYHFTHTATKLIQSYLNNRHHFVKIGENIS